jgi:hypothetical protein
MRPPHSSRQRLEYDASQQARGIAASHLPAGRRRTADAPAPGHLHRFPAKTGHPDPFREAALDNYARLLAQIRKGKA